MRIFYIGHPAAEYNGDPASLVDECIGNPDQHDGWLLKSWPYDKKASLSVRDFCAPISATPGPVLLLMPLQGKVVADIRRRLTSRVPVDVATIVTIDDLRESIKNLGLIFTAGEPLIALDVAVALLLMRKLDIEHMWAGNAKGYMWSDNLAKGRGLDEKYKPRIAHVVNVLYQHNLLTSKTSNSKSKYALNPARRQEIYDALRQRSLPHATQTVLSRGQSSESGRVLDLLSNYDQQEQA